jgi:hypothetical protein
MRPGRVQGAHESDCGNDFHDLGESNEHSFEFLLDLELDALRIRSHCPSAARYRAAKTADPVGQVQHSFQGEREP